MTPIDEWLAEFVVMCFALMGLIAWALHVICKAGEDYINDINNEENGKDA